MTDYRNVVPACASQNATISRLIFTVCHERTLRHCAERENVSDGKGSLLASKDELTLPSISTMISKETGYYEKAHRVHPFISDDFIRQSIVTTYWKMEH